jgi:GT2 family glycosyltransferase
MLAEDSVQHSCTSTQRVAIVLLNWNNADDTLACVESLSRLRYRDFRIVIVDNFSRPSDYLELKSRCGDGLILRQKRNLGFAGGCNAGMRWALRNGFQYVWLLNCDTVVDSESLGELVRAMDGDRSIGVVGGIMYYWNEPERIQIAAGSIDPETGRGGVLGLDQLDIGQFSGIRDTDYVCGGTLLAKSAAIKEVGLLDERFFMYYEDTDWGVRMRQRGWRVVSTSAAKAWHKARASAGKKQPYFIQHGYFMFLYKNFPRYLPHALRLYARHHLRPNLESHEWRLAWADAKVYWKFLTRLAFVRPNLEP